MSCHLLGADEVEGALESAFRGAGATDFSIREVSCLGRCDQAPAIMVNDNIYARANSHDAIAMAHDVLAGKPLPGTHAQSRSAQAASCDPYGGTGQYARGAPLR